MARGRVGDADAAIHRVVDEAEGHAERSRVLAACVEIDLAAGDADAARAATNELEQLAADFDWPYLWAVTLTRTQLYRGTMHSWSRRSRSSFA